MCVKYLYIYAFWLYKITVGVNISWLIIQSVNFFHLMHSAA